MLLFISHVSFHPLYHLQIVYGNRVMLSVCVCDFKRHVSHIVNKTNAPLTVHVNKMYEQILDVNRVCHAALAYVEDVMFSSMSLGFSFRGMLNLCCATGNVSFFRVLL